MVPIGIILANQTYNQPRILKMIGKERVDELCPNFAGILNVVERIKT